MINKILKEKQSILATSEQKNVTKLKKFGRSKNYELEIKLCEWIKSKNESGMVLSGDDIRSKAKAMSQKLGYESNMGFSHGWLQRFKIRYNLKCKKLVGEKANADFKTADQFVKRILPEILEKISNL